MDFFTIRGQLIHGSEQIFNLDQPLKLDRKGGFKLNRGIYIYDTYATEELRPIAFNPHSARQAV